MIGGILLGRRTRFVAFCPANNGQLQSLPDGVIDSNTPMRDTLSLDRARAAIGHAAAPPTSVMNSRRFIAPSEARDKASTLARLP